MNLVTAFTLLDIPVQQVHDPLLDAAGLSLSVLRLDLVHPVISGNKWFKLKYNLIQAGNAGLDTLLSFGGPWSNHLHALAAAGSHFGFRTIGVVRGELPTPLNACLQDCRNAGMQLIGISRTDYGRKGDPDFLNDLRGRVGDSYLIPEGGANRAGIQGCSEISRLYSAQEFDVVCMACGTGTTLAGMAGTSQVPLLGFQVLKGDGYLAKEVAGYLANFDIKPTCPWSVIDSCHVGGYARTSPALMQFITDFESRHDIPLEPVYSGKLLYGIVENVNKRDFFPRNSRILAIHGGGLQGKRGFL